MAARHRAHIIPIGLSILILAAVLLWRGMDGLALNLGYVALVKAGLQSGSYSALAQDALEQAAPTQPAARWGLALLARWRGDAATSNAHLTDLLSTGRPRIRLLQALVATEQANAGLAALAWQQHAHTAAAAFWYAESVSAADPAAAIEAYQAGLRLAPRDGLRWVRLGRLYVETGEPELALAAFGHGCLYWDQGKNGCLLAAGLAEEMRLADQARHYYRRALEQLPGHAPALQRLEALSP